MLKINQTNQLINQYFSQIKLVFAKLEVDQKDIYFCIIEHDYVFSD